MTPRGTGRDIFDSDADVLVCPTNGVGVMGVGLAKQFAERFPGLAQSHKALCDVGEQLPGCIATLGRKSWDKKVALVPTKRHWRDASNLDDVALSIRRLGETMAIMPNTTFAVPKLGCGLGGLDWADVKPLIEQHLDMSRVELFE